MLAPPRYTHCGTCGDELPTPRDAKRRYCDDACATTEWRRRDAARTTEQRRATAAAYYQRKKEERKAYNRATRERQRELARARYAKDSARKKAAALKWAAENPEKAKANQQRRRARKTKAPTIYFTAEQAEQRLAYFGRKCWICFGDGPHIDHVKPLIAGGWHCLSNLRPICPSCNASKGGQWPYDPTARREALGLAGKHSQGTTPTELAAAS